MTEIATLGVNIVTRGIDEAANGLQRVTNAGRNAETQNTALAASFTELSNHMRNVTYAITSLSSQMQQSTNNLGDRIISEMDRMRAAYVTSTQQMQNAINQLGARTSSVMDRVAVAVGASSDRLQQAFNVLDIRTASEMERLRSAATSAFNQIRNSGVASADEISRAYRGLQDRLREINGRVDGVGSSFSSLGRYVGLAFAGFSIRGVITQLFEAGAAIERLRNSFQSITGNAGAAASSMAFVRSESERLGLNLLSTSDAYMKLSAASKGTALQGEKTEQIFSAVAGASRAIGLSSEQMSGALLALQQMMSKGTVQAEELRGQLGERLPGAFQIAARAMGVSTAELGKMLEGGKVISDDFLPKFAAELEKTFTPGTKALQGMSAETERLKTAWFDLKTTVMDKGGGSIFTDAITGMKGMVVEADSFYKRMYDAWDILKRFARNPMDSSLIPAQERKKAVPLTNLEKQYTSVSGISGGMGSSLFTPEFTGMKTPAMAQADFASQLNRSPLYTEADAKADAARISEVQKLRKAAAIEESTAAAKRLNDINQRDAALKKSYQDQQDNLRETNVGLTKEQQAIEKIWTTYKNKLETLKATDPKYKEQVAMVDTMAMQLDEQLQAEIELAKTTDDRNAALKRIEQSKEAALKIDRLELQEKRSILKEIQRQSEFEAEIANQRNKNIADEAQLQADKAAGNGGFEGINAQLEAEKAAITARFEAERAGINNRIDLLMEGTNLELEQIDLIHQTRMEAILTENLAVANGIENEKQRAAEITRIKSQHDALNVESSKRSEELKAKQFNQTVAMVTVLQKALTLSADKEQQAQLTAEQKANKSKMQAVSGYATFGAEAFKTLADVQDQSSREGFESAKAFNLAAAVMSTAAGIINQFTTGDPYTAWVRAALVAATGAIQIAQISSTSFGGGGSVSAPSGSVSGGGGGATGGSMANVQTPGLSVEDSQRQDATKMLETAINKNTVVIGKLSDSIERLDGLFKEGGAGMGLATNAPGRLVNTDSESPFSGIKNDMRNGIKLGIADIGSGGGLGISDALLGGALSSSAALTSVISRFAGSGKWNTTGAGLSFDLSGGEAAVSDYVTSSRKKNFHTKNSITISENEDASQYMTALFRPFIDDLADMADTLGLKFDETAYKAKVLNIQTSGKSAEDIGKELQTLMKTTLESMTLTIPGIEKLGGTYDNMHERIIAVNNAFVTANEQLALIGDTVLTELPEDQWLDAGIAMENAIKSFWGGTEGYIKAQEAYRDVMYTQPEKDRQDALERQRKINTLWSTELQATYGEIPETISAFNTIRNTIDPSSPLYKSLTDIGILFGETANKVAETRAILVDKQMELLELQNGKESAEYLALVTEKRNEYILTLPLEARETQKLIDSENDKIASIQKAKTIQDESAAATQKAAQDAAAALNAMNDSISRTASMSIRILNAQGNTGDTTPAGILYTQTNSLLAKRIELETALQIAVNKGEDVTQLAIATNLEWANAVRQSTETVTKAAKDLLMVDVTNTKSDLDKSLQSWVQATSDARAAAEGLLDRSYRVVLDKMTQSITKLSDLIESLGSSISGLNPSVDQQADFKAAMRDLNAMLIAARTGDFSLATSATASDTIKAVSNINPADYATAIDYSRSVNMVRGQLVELQTLASLQKTAEEITQELMQNQYDALKGIQENILPIAEARSNYIDAVNQNERAIATVGLVEAAVANLQIAFTTGNEADQAIWTNYLNQLGVITDIWNGVGATVGASTIVSAGAWVTALNDLANILTGTGAGGTTAIPTGETATTLISSVYSDIVEIIQTGGNTGIGEIVTGETAGTLISSLYKSLATALLGSDATISATTITTAGSLIQGVYSNVAAALAGTLEGGKISDTDAITLIKGVYTNINDVLATGMLTTGGVLSSESALTLISGVYDAVNSALKGEGADVVKLNSADAITVINTAYDSVTDSLVNDVFTVGSEDDTSTTLGLIKDRYLNITDALKNSVFETTTALNTISTRYGNVKLALDSAFSIDTAKTNITNLFTGKDGIQVRLTGGIESITKAVNDSWAAYNAALQKMTNYVAPFTTSVATTPIETPAPTYVSPVQEQVNTVATLPKEGFVSYTATQAQKDALSSRESVQNAESISYKSGEAIKSTAANNIQYYGLSNESETLNIGQYSGIITNAIENVVFDGKKDDYQYYATGSKMAVFQQDVLKALIPLGYYDTNIRFFGDPPSEINKASVYYDGSMQFNKKNLPQLATGSDYLPYDMIAQIHEGERIIPKADNYELMRRLDYPQNIDMTEVVAELRAVKAELASIKAGQFAIAKNTMKSADRLDRWDGDGMPEVRAVA